MEKLAEILNQELLVFNHFLDLLDQQHKQIISRQLDELNETNSQLDKLSSEAQFLERQRRNTVDRISRELHLTGLNTSLHDLLPNLGRDSSNRLHLLRESILGAHRQAEEKSARNKSLIDKSRKLIADSMRIISKKPSPVYQKPGSGQAPITEGGPVNRSI